MAAVKLPMLKIYKMGVQADHQSLGLVGGVENIVAVRENFMVLLEMLIKLASLQTSFVTMDEALKVTNRTMSTLEIACELDELECGCTSPNTTTDAVQVAQEGVKVYAQVNPTSYLHDNNS
eukprot:12901444-Ditylum_brightwellii.AAC.1